MDAQPKTILMYGNSASWDASSNSQTIKSKTSHTIIIENIKDNVWRCMHRDYFHEVGVNSLIKSKSFASKPLTGPIDSHRFKAIRCIDCERCILYYGWKRVDYGHCSVRCVGQNCADCGRDPFSIFTLSLM